MKSDPVICSSVPSALLTRQRDPVGAVLVLREVAGEVEADRLGGALAGAPEYAVQLAAHRAALQTAELEELQRVLAAQGTKLPKELFDSSHAELLRYAATHGMLEVSACSPAVTSEG